MTTQTQVICDMIEFNYQKLLESPTESNRMRFDMSMLELENHLHSLQLNGEIGG